MMGYSLKEITLDRETFEEDDGSKNSGSEIFKKMKMKVKNSYLGMGFMEIRLTGVIFHLNYS